ncbi:MAG: cytochrome b6-f complex iron-sulfur subunit [Actinomycetota bacterium]|jgi:cytochrome b6-f complex iron-sulfur subunit|nr:cytochrome b6-f complex iron-sulfur subunit [Actinomycetota bacterium]
MNAGTIALIVVALSVALWGLFMANTIIRRQRKAALATATPAEAPTEPQAAGATSASAQEPADPPKVTVETVPPARRKPLTTDQLAVTRRQFLNRAWTMSFLGFLGFFGLSTLSFLWPKLTGGFGTKITAGNYNDILSQIGPNANYAPQYVAEGRFYLVYYGGDGSAPVYLATKAKQYKMQALYRKCVHLGCSPPWCSTSTLFECPCHGSKYTLAGEYFAGPAPRGLDRFPISVSGGKIVVDTGNLQTGPPRGTASWPQFNQPNGPFCIPT